MYRVSLFHALVAQIAEIGLWVGEKNKGNEYDMLMRIHRCACDMYFYP